eukprot:TRINITY_DN1596_c0_g1_i1.p1 TRINITY_DN1596_c0_g1~~TRINITY_DN1596_c0_g1_i1.p1  ORF type:complete len:114 (+),score=9.88 TRINITY_DN1596_c0_g1_i1:151-492(+)
MSTRKVNRIKCKPNLNKPKKKLNEVIAETEQFIANERYAPGSKINAEYANQIYLEWLNTIELPANFNPYPLSPEVVCSFLVDLRKEWGFSMSTVASVFSYNLLVVFDHQLQIL